MRPGAGEEGASRNLKSPRHRGSRWGYYISSVVVFGAASAAVFTAKLSHKNGREAGYCGNASRVEGVSPRLWSGVGSITLLRFLG